MKLLNKGCVLFKLRSSLRKTYSRHHVLVNHYRITVTNDHGYALLVVSTSRSYPHSPEFISCFSGVRVARSLVLCVNFVDRCLSFCPFFFWPLCRLSFFDLRIMITPLVFSNSSWLYLAMWCYRFVAWVALFLLFRIVIFCVYVLMKILERILNTTITQRREI